MIIFRPHRGSLVEAMKEAKEFSNEQDMKEFIVYQWDNYFSIEDIVIDNELINDDRIGWKDTRYVCTKRFGNKIYVHPQCIGMCATNYINTSPMPIENIKLKDSDGKGNEFWK